MITDLPAGVTVPSVCTTTAGRPPRLTAGDLSTSAPSSGGGWYLAMRRMRRCGALMVDTADNWRSTGRCGDWTRLPCIEAPPSDPAPTEPSAPSASEGVFCCLAANNVLTTTIHLTTTLLLLLQRTACWRIEKRWDRWAQRPWERCHPVADPWNHPRRLHTPTSIS